MASFSRPENKPRPEHAPFWTTLHTAQARIRTGLPCSRPPAAREQGQPCLRVAVTRGGGREAEEQGSTHSVLRQLPGHGTRTSPELADEPRGSHHPPQLRTYRSTRACVTSLCATTPCCSHVGFTGYSPSGTCKPEVSAAVRRRAPWSDGPGVRAWPHRHTAMSERCTELVSKAAPLFTV